MCKTLFKKIIYNMYNCKREYPFINIGDDFERYIKLEEEILNNEYVFKSAENNMVKRLYLDFCVYKDITKFQLYQEVLDAPFMCDNAKSLFIHNFHLLQKAYFGLIKFREVIKQKIYPKQITFDMKMSEIDPKSKHSIVICQNKKLYYFTMSDMLNIIEHNLTSGDFFFIIPMFIKNPYNNMVLLKSTLYNIYFQYKFHTLYQNKTFDYFFDCNFDITSIKDNYYDYLLKQNIKHHIDNLCQEELVCEIKNMINCVNRAFIFKINHITIGDKFPNNTIIKALTPFYTHFMQIKYSLTYHEYFQKLSIFKANIIKFIEYNPLFGRVIIKVERRNSFGASKKYHDNFFIFNPHIHVKNEFLTSHYQQKTSSVFQMYENKFKWQNIIYNRILELGPHSYKYSGILNNPDYHSPSLREYEYNSDDITIDSDVELEDIQFRYNHSHTPDHSPPPSPNPHRDSETIENDNSINDISGNTQ